MLPVFHENMQPTQVFVTLNKILEQLNIMQYQVKLTNCHGLPFGPKQTYLWFEICQKD